MALRSFWIALAVLLAFALGGQPFLNALGISLAAFKVAGGLMVFLIAIDMVFEKRTERRESRAEEILASATSPEEDISVFPMAIPMLAGPGAIAAMMLLTARAHSALELAAVLAAGPIMAVMGAKFEGALTRLLGVVLAALAAQFVIDGVKQSFGL